MRLRAASGVLACVILVAPGLHPVRAQDKLVVSPDGPYRTIEAALAEADDGDVIEVHGGVYSAPLVIEASVSLVGFGNPVIDGKGEGSLVFVNAPGVLFQGFTLRGTGRNLDHEDTAIVVQSSRVTIADNVLEDVLFGIYFAAANDGAARNNRITGKDLDLGMRGDGLRVWYSSGVTLAGNEVTTSRDALIWYADNITIENNHFHGNRYGLHFMYSKNARVQGNTFENNHVGAYLMYTDGLTVADNVSAYNRGPSGYGLALKDADHVTVSDNLLVGNRAGLYIDNSPALYDGYNTYTRNVFAYNDVGITMLPSVQRNVFTANSFLENIQQASTQGRGTLQGNLWQQDGQGNYWSDYAGYDRDGDGTGELPYRSEKLFESLMDARPALRLFTYSPATQALDFAAAAFPTLRPEPKLVDDAPVTRYVLPEQFAAGPAQVSLPLLAAALLLVAAGSGVCVYAARFVFPRPKVSDGLAL